MSTSQPARTRWRPAAVVTLLLPLCWPWSGLAEESCIGCHRQVTPNIVAEWHASKHSEKGVSCAACHGDKHSGPEDSDLAEHPLPETCATCHSSQVDQYLEGKHALAWAAVKLLPPTHQLPMSVMWGRRGCAGCHNIGIKSEADLEEVAGYTSGFGIASCDACHTRHLFSAREAREPEACKGCHIGFDHPQWEMYSNSKHGVRHQLKRDGILPDSAQAPTCQTCHMPDGHHGVRTAWGYMAVRLPLPEASQWKQDQATILRALGLFDAEGKPTKRRELFERTDAARLTRADWQQQRDRMTAVCTQCHSLKFTQAQLAQGDEMVREADRLLAQAIELVAALYQEGILEPAAGAEEPFPDLMTMQDVPPSPIEQRLFIMYLKHRTSAIQGTFHNNVDYALWNGWAEMIQDLAEIQAMAADLRSKH